MKYLSIGALFLALALNGCAKYPIVKDNILSSPSRFNVQSFVKTNQTKEQIINDVMNGLGNMDGVFERDDMERSLNDKYNRLVDDNDLFGIFKRNIKNSIDDIQIKRKNYKGDVIFEPQFSEDYKINKNNNKFNIIVNLDSGIVDWKFNSGDKPFHSTSKITINMSGDYIGNNGDYSGSISSIGYLIECKGGIYGASNEVVELITIDDPKLIEIVSNIKTKPVNIANELTKTAREMISDRNMKNRRYASSNQKDSNKENASSTSTSDWTLFATNAAVGGDYDGDLSYINLKTMNKESGGRVTAWTRVDKKIPFAGATRLESKMSADCEGGKLYALHSSGFGRDGQFLGTDNTFAESILRPNSIDAKLFRIMCGKGDPKL